MPGSTLDEKRDLVLETFLGFLASDLAKNPNRALAVDRRFVARLRALTRDIPVDLDARLPEDEQE